MDSVLPNDDAVGETAGRETSRSLAVWALVSLMVAATAGCTLDFDQFDAGSGADAGPSGDGTEFDGDSVPPDAGPTDTSGSELPGNADADGDATAPTELVVGRECESDDDCYGDAGCVDNYCTTDCDTADDCPGDTICAEWAGRRRCLVPCSDSCPSVEGRLDLRCSSADRRPTVGAPADGARACLPDGDGDYVADRVDTCPDTPNATQLDRDADGDGDACDVGAERCHATAEGGAIEFGSVTYPAADASIPETVDGSFLPVVGGRHEGAGYAKLARLDFRNGEWASPADLPYPSSGQGVAPLRGVDGYIATPGASTAADTQRGRFVVFGPDSVRLDGPYGLDTDAPLMATDGQGTLFVLGTRPSDSDSRIRLWRYRPDGGGFQQIHDQTLSQSRTWHATRGIRGDLYLYSTPVARNAAPPRGRVLEIDVFRSAVSPTTLEYPEITPPDGSPRPMDPVLVPGPGADRMYAFDRRTGRAGIVDLDENTVVREPSIDLSLPFTVEHAAVVPGASGVVLVGRDKNAPDQLRAQAIYPACHPTFLSLNSDDDPVQDVADNCPEISNPSQSDADEDRIGDACDDDGDNDGIPNVEDFQSAGNGQMQTSLDTDNDGTPNSGDDDDDADGLSDGSDRYPFDTDDDGLPNHVDDDDDDDGYADQPERDGDADPLDPLDFPDAGSVAFVRRSGGTGGDRTVEVGPLTALDSATEIVPASHDPYRPRLFDGGAGVVALAGRPGQTTSLVWWTESSGGTTTHDAQQLLYDVVPGSVDENGSLQTLSLARRPSDESTGWTVDDYTVASGMSQTRIDAFQTISSVDRVGSTFAVVGGPADCTPCLSLYSIGSEEDRPRLRAAPPGRLGRVHYDGNRFGFTAATGPGDRRGYIATGGAVDELDLPERVTQIASVVPLEMHGHVLASAKTKNDSFDIWFYNGRKQRWHRIHHSSDDLIEIDWIK